MSTEGPRFQSGDNVIVVDGAYKGRYGKVMEYDEVSRTYQVLLPEVHPDWYFGVSEDDLEFLGDEEEGPAEEDDEGYIPVAEFGMTDEAYAAHLEFMVQRVLDGVPTTGPAQAFFGFQEWEALEPKEIYAKILEKIEDGMRLFVQLHVLTARVGYALEQMEQMNDQNE